MTMISDFDLCDCCEQRSDLSIETLRTIRPDFIQVDELINGKLNHLTLIDVSEIHFDDDYKYNQDDPLNEYLNRPLNKFEVYMRDGALYHHYILEEL